MLPTHLKSKTRLKGDFAVGPLRVQPGQTAPSGQWASTGSSHESLTDSAGEQQRGSGPCVLGAVTMTESRLWTQARTEGSQCGDQSRGGQWKHRDDSLRVGGGGYAGQH